jgi:hypothetical protein
MLEWFGRQSDLLAEITHLYLVFEGRVRVAMVKIHNVDPTSLCSLLQEIENQFLS